MNSRERRRYEKKRNSNIKMIILIAIAAVVLLGCAGTAFYFVSEKSAEEARQKEAEEKRESCVQALTANIETAKELCPEVLKFVGKSDTAGNYFVENIENGKNLYEKANNANSLIRTAAFYLDQYMAVDISGVEAGKDPDVHYTAETMEYNDKMAALRNDFTNNWFTYLGIDGAQNSIQETEEES